MVGVGVLVKVPVAVLVKVPVGVPVKVAVLGGGVLVKVGVGLFVYDLVGVGVIVLVGEAVGVLVQAIMGKISIWSIESSMYGHGCPIVCQFMADRLDFTEASGTIVPQPVSCVKSEKKSWYCVHTGGAIKVIL